MSARAGVLLLPGWGFGPERLAAIAPAGAARVEAAAWDRARGPDELVPLALEAAARLPGALTVVGWSLGAMVALEALPALAAEPGRLAALHLVAPCLCFTAAWPARVLARMRRRCAEAPGDVLAAFARGLLAPGEADLPPAPGRAWPVRSLVAGLDYLAGRDLASPAPIPGCRARVVHGGADPVVPPELSVAVGAALGAERRVLAGAGHAPQLTRAAECAAFLRGEGHAPG